MDFLKILDFLLFGFGAGEITGGIEIALVTFKESNDESETVETCGDGFPTTG